MICTVLVRRIGFRTTSRDQEEIDVGINRINKVKVRDPRIRSLEPKTLIPNFSLDVYI